MLHIIWLAQGRRGSFWLDKQNYHIHWMKLARIVVSKHAVALLSICPHIWTDLQTLTNWKWDSPKVRSLSHLITKALTKNTRYVFTFQWAKKECHSHHRWHSFTTLTLQVNCKKNCKFCVKPAANSWFTTDFAVYLWCHHDILFKISQPD